MDRTSTKEVGLVLAIAIHGLRIDTVDNGIVDSFRHRIVRQIGLRTREAVGVFLAGIGIGVKVGLNIGKTNIFVDF